MDAPASKRRKTEHSSDEDKDDQGSFASFGASEGEDGHFEEDGGSSGEALEDEHESGGLEDGEAEEDEEDGDETEETRRILNGASRQNTGNTRQAMANPRASSTLKRRVGDELAFASGNFKSNMFKMQVDELLEQIRPRHGKKEKAAKEALHEIKSTIERIPARPPLPVDEAERKLLEQDNVAVPFPSPRPPKDAKYKLEYQKPANVNVAGSYALKTISRARHVLEVDMTLTMASAMFQEKDFLNHRYFYKRAFYLASVAAGLKKSLAGKFEMRFASFADNRLLPVVVIEPHDQDAKATWRINILPCVAQDVFAPEKLLPERNSVRGSELSTEDGRRAQLPTAFYNSTLRSDMLVTPYLKLLHSGSKTCDAFKDACLLGSTWLRQRGLGSDLHAGGFGSFEWSALIALMLSGGGPKGTPILSPAYSTYQLFKATLQVLAMKDLNKQPFVIGASDYSPRASSDGAPIVWDSERSHNLLYKMAPWSYKHLRQEARITLNLLGDQNYDGFDAAFILRSDGEIYRYDHITQTSFIETGPDHLPHDMQTKLYRALQEGLGDRVSSINLTLPATRSWKVDAVRSEQQLERTLRICLVVNPESVGRTVDHGPSAEEKTEAAAFRKFWGEKAELRRFKDGSIRESLIWSSNEGAQSVLEQIVRYVTQKHVSKDIEDSMVFVGDNVRRLLPHGSATAQFQALAQAFKTMESDIRGLEGLPLSIRQIMPADAQLRSASARPPLSGSRPMPADVVIQFEGSTRWPDDLVAIQRTKIAFLLKLSELLQDSVGSITTRIGLENHQHDILSQGYLDIIYDSGATFRMRIYHDREQTLLERQLRDKSLDPRSKEIAALGLAKHRRDYTKAPAHTEAIARLCSRYPALSGTIRLMKKWFASHLLFNHIADEVIEFLAAKTFIQPWPWRTPSSVQTAFLRTLFFLSRWDWRAEPLIVDLSGSGDLKQAELQSIRTKFEAWRKIDPALNRVVLFAASSVDLEGTTWTDGRPAKVVAGRMTALAKAACGEVVEREAELEPSSLFASSLADFDFVLHLDPTLIGKRKARKSKANAFKNLELEVMDDSDLIGSDPVIEFVQELDSVFGAAVLLFSGGHERPVIAGLWSPQTKARPWKVNLAYSTVPRMADAGEEVLADVNRGGILAEMARLGGDMVVRVEGGGNVG